MQLGFTWSSVVYITVSIISRNAVAAQTADFVLDCPPTFKDRKENLVNATVSTTKFSQCDDDQVKRVVFTVIPPVGVSKAICEQPYPDCNTTTNSEGCRCVNKIGSTYTYQLNFIFYKETQTGSSLDLRPSPCISFTYPYPFIHSPCNNLTGSDTPTPPASQDSKDQSTDLGAGIGIPLGIILILLGHPMYVFICWVISKKYRENLSKKQPTSGPPPPLPPGWHVHYLCGKKIEYVYFSQCCVKKERTVLIFSRSPSTQRCIFFGSEDGPSGARVAPADQS